VSETHVVRLREVTSDNGRVHIHTRCLLCGQAAIAFGQLAEVVELIIGLVREADNTFGGAAFDAAIEQAQNKSC
jgi:hypothetical protein